MKNSNCVLFFLAVVGCAKQGAAPAPAAPTALEPARAQSPSERAGEASVTPQGVRMIATLDQAVGPKFSKTGDRFLATIQPGSIFPAGDKISGRVVEIHPAMNGSTAFVLLVVDGVQGAGGELEPIDARIAGVEMLEKQVGGREVNSTAPTSGELIGSIIPREDLPQADAVRRDPLGKGVVVALGTGDQPAQLDKGARLAIDVRSATEWQRVAGLEPVREVGNKLEIGRSVDLNDVPVESVIGDVVFWVGTSKSERTLVVLDKLIDSPETHIVVRAGMHVSLHGVVERTPTADEAPRLWKLVSHEEAEEFRGHPSYMFATRATVVR